MAKLLTQEQLIDKVSRILSYPPMASHASIAAETGFDREIIRRIRFGIKYNHILPELPRMEQSAAKVKCSQCIQWYLPKDVEDDRYGDCSLGIPECKLHGQNWARGCGAFLSNGGEDND